MPFTKSSSAEIETTVVTGFSFWVMLLFGGSGGSGISGASVWFVEFYGGSWIVVWFVELACVVLLIVVLIEFVGRVGLVVLVLFCYVLFVAVELL